MGFGEAKFDNSGGSFKKNHRIEWGENVYRILPAYGSLQFDGKWFQYHRLHWGAFILDSEGKPGQRPFLCPEVTDYKTKEVIVPCAACDEIRKNSDERDRTEVRLKEAGVPEDQIRDQLKKYGEWSKQYNASGRYYTNAMNVAGEVGLLPLNRTLKDDLEKQCRALGEKKINALSLDRGVWFKFTRTKGATWRDPGFSVTPVKEERVLEDGVVAEVLIPSSLSETQIQAALAGATDLKFEPPARRFTPEEIERLVDSGWDVELATTLFSSPGADNTPTHYTNGAPIRQKAAPAPIQKAAPAPVAQAVVQQLEQDLPPAQETTAVQPATSSNILGGRSIGELGSMGAAEFKAWMEAKNSR